MAFNKFFICQIWNFCRITSRYITIRCIRKERSIDCHIHQFIRICKRSLHLIKDNTFVAWLSLAIKLIVPSFLIKNFWLCIYSWIKYSIQINSHQIDKILIISACHRIKSLIRKCHCIQKCVHGIF